MSDKNGTEHAPSPPPHRLPGELHPALTAEQLLVCARLLVRGRAEAFRLADPWAGDDAWSIGCRAYSFSRNQLRQAATTGRYDWLGVLDETHHFVFLIKGVPVRLFRGDAAEPTKRALRRQENEAQQLALALGSEDGAEGLMFRLALEPTMPVPYSGSCSWPCAGRKAGSSASGRCRWRLKQPRRRKASSLPRARQRAAARRSPTCYSSPLAPSLPAPASARSVPG